MIGGKMAQPGDKLWSMHFGAFVPVDKPDFSSRDT